MITNERLQYLREWLEHARDQDGVESTGEDNSGWTVDLMDAISELLSRRRDASERRFAPKSDK